MSKRLLALFAMLAMLLGYVAAGPAQAAPKPSPALSKVTAKPVPGKSGVRKGIKAPKGRPGVTAAPRSFTSCPGGVCFEYVEKNQTLPAGDSAQGFAVNVPITRPFLANASNNTSPNNDNHTLVELAVSDGANVVEIGVTTDPVVNSGNANPNDPALFVYAWVNGAEGVYNGGPGWANEVNCGTNGSCAGTSLAGAVGTSKQLRWQHIGTAWWAMYNNQFVGAFDDSHWTSPVFTAATKAAVYSEIASNNVESCSDMNAGIIPPGAGYSVISGFASDATTPAALSLGTVTNSARWGQNVISSTSFGIGGPGNNSVGEALGTKDHCASNAEGIPTSASLQLWKEICPDNQGTTGCNKAQAFNTSIGIGVCTPITGAGTTQVNAVWNNSGVVRSYRIWRTIGCTGSSKTYTNGQKEAFPFGGGWNGTAVRAVMRLS